MQIIDVLFNSLGYALTSKPFEKPELTEEQIKKLYSICRNQDISNVVAYGLSESGHWNKKEYEYPVQKKFFTDMYASIMRSVQKETAFADFCDLFEESKIEFVPLKGIIMKDLYPKSWMRTSCDLDILIHRDELEKAENILVKAGYEKTHVTTHDVAFRDSSGTVVIELHYDLVEDSRAGASAEVLSGVWDYVSPEEGKKYRLKMTREMFYFYHIAHLSKHFETSGCGVRFFMDLYLLDKYEKPDRKILDGMLKTSGLDEFEKQTLKLAKIWFSDEETEFDSVTRSMADYVLGGGVYGKEEKRLSALVARKGKVGYILSLMFLPKDVMVKKYPSLKNKGFLLPAYWVYRWCRIIFGGKTGNAVKNISEISKAETVSADIENMMKRLGL